MQQVRNVPWNVSSWAQPSTWLSWPIMIIDTFSLLCEKYRQINPIGMHCIEEANIRKNPQSIKTSNWRKDNYLTIDKVWTSCNRYQRAQIRIREEDLYPRPPDYAMSFTTYITDFRLMHSLTRNSAHDCLKKMSTHGFLATRLKWKSSKHWIAATGE